MLVVTVSVSRSSSVATGGHVPAHPAPAVLGHGIHADRKSF